MFNLYRVSRFLSAINASNAVWPVLARTLVKNKIQPEHVCFYCKKYGLYDNEDDETLGEFNKRGAYIDHRSSNFEKDVIFDEDDEDYQDVSRNRQHRKYSSRGTFDSGRKYSAFDNVDDESYYNNNRSYNQNRQNRFDHSSRNTTRFSNFKFDNVDRYNGPRSQNQYQRYPNQNQHYPSQNQNTFYQSIKKSVNEHSTNSENVSSVEKNFYTEHANVASMSEEDVKKFLKAMNITVRGQNVPRPVTNFGELTISESLLQAVKSENFSSPTAIQSQGWPIALSGRDMIGVSQTGSGKTLVFALPAMVHVMNQTRYEATEFECFPQALVLAPTRELAQQINDVTTKFRHYCGIRSACVYGGASKRMQYDRLRTCQMCIATPGRLLDFLQDGSVNLKHCTYLVLDEADRMLDMGFEPQIRQIIKQIRPDRQTLMWSATWPTEVQTLAEDFLDNYIQVTVGNEDLSANPNIKQNIIVLEEQDKGNRLLDLLESLQMDEPTKVLIFAQTKRSVDLLSRQLNNKGILAMAIHGDVSQAGRDRVLTSFRNHSSGVLVATDVAARGLDVSDIEHVINFDFPLNIEDYIHRIGRTARGEKTGTAHSFFTADDAGVANDLINVLNRVGQHPSQELLALLKKRRMAKSSPMFFNRNRYQRRNY